MAPPPAMPRSRKILIVLGSTVAALALAAFGAWWFVLRSDAPAPVSLDDAVESLSTTTTGAANDTTTTTVPSDDLSGTWVVDTGSFAGYRVQEELANVGFTTAAGRRRPRGRHSHRGRGVGRHDRAGERLGSARSCHRDPGSGDA